MSRFLGFAEMTFGVEVECLFPPRHQNIHNVNAMLQAAGLNKWKAEHDGSLRPNPGSRYFGVEIKTSPYITGEEAEAEIERLGAFLKSAGAKVNKSCGVHVHVGARQMTAKEIAKVVAGYAKWQGQIMQVLSPSRHSNHFCKPLGQAQRVYNYSTNQYEARGGLPELLEKLAKANTVEEVAKAANGGVGSGRYPTERYYSVNLQAYWRLGTIEFRQHQGTVEAAKLWGWVRFLGEFVLATKAVTSFPKPAPAEANAKHLFWRFTQRVSEPSAQWLVERAANFRAEAQGATLPAAA